MSEEVRRRQRATKPRMQSIDDVFNLILLQENSGKYSKPSLMPINFRGSSGLNDSDSDSDSISEVKVTLKDKKMRINVKFSK
jgi:hypothetical protein